MVQVSLCVIARDEERFLEGCLASARPYVDEMVVVDTGSSDGTVPLARSLGAQVDHFAWCDDFAAARNHALQLARGDWILCLDADERLHVAPGRHLRELLPQRHQALLILLRSHPEWTASWVCRLFRNRPELRYRGRIHETVLPSLARLIGEAGGGSEHAVRAGLPGEHRVMIEHAAYHPETVTGKRQRNLPLLEAELAARPERAIIRYDLALIYEQQGRERQAFDLVCEGIAGLGQELGTIDQVAAFLYLCAARLNPGQAQRLCREGVERFPASLLLRLALGELLLCDEQPEEARAQLQAAVELVESEGFDRVLPLPLRDVERRSFEGLAGACWALGDRDEAERLHTGLAARFPEDLRYRATLEVIAYHREQHGEQVGT